MAHDDRREGRDNRDLVLAPNQYAHVSDETKGEIVCYTGPFKASLANEQRPVFFNPKSKRFETCPLEEAICTFAIAPEGWYGILKNPSAKEPMHPEPGSQNSKSSLHVGRKVNMPGPFSFALFPGQMIRVVRGHMLSSNQYLLTRVYDADEAQKNIGSTISAASGTAVTDAFDALSEDATPEEIQAAKEADIRATEVKKEEAVAAAAKNLSMGAQSIIKGTEVSFYIPPTGIEVVPDEDGNFVRDAVTLEQLEYCILVDESGDKRYERGPQVVFPEPTEDFIRSSSNKTKFRAFELNDNMGLHIKVIMDYTDAAGKEHVAGEEIFITGKEQRIYFPRVEHMLIKYGSNNTIHYAVVVPKGEGRYVLNKDTSDIKLVKGPNMLLPDPTKEVLVKRILSDRQCQLWFPGNQEALAYNQGLREALGSEGVHQQFISEEILANTQVSGLASDASVRGLRNRRASIAMYRSGSTSDDEYDADAKLARKSNFTQPRSITLDNKFEGAVIVDIWPGYAVQKVSKTGKREVIQGPNTFLLEFDETLQHMEMSTGKPKNDHHLVATPYLKVHGNRVSDIVRVVTLDLVEVDIRVNYNSNFTGKPDNWFLVDNYVKLMTQECRSRIRNAAKKMGIQDLMDNATDMIRDTILGTRKEDGERPGHTFRENGVHIYEVEVLDVDVLDSDIGALLKAAQHNTVHNTLEILKSEQELKLTKVVSTNTRETEKIRHLSAMDSLREESARKKAVAAQVLEALQDKAAQDALNRKLEEAALQMRIALDDHETTVMQERAEVRTSAIQAQFEAITPALIEALIAVGDKQLATTMMENLPKANGELGTLLGIGGIPALMQSFAGTPVEKVLRGLGVDKNHVEPNEKVES